MTGTDRTGRVTSIAAGFVTVSLDAGGVLFGPLRTDAEGRLYVDDTPPPTAADRFEDPATPAAT